MLIISKLCRKYYNYLFFGVVAIYNFMPKKIRPIILLLFSLLFFTLISTKLVVFLILTIISIYFSALLIEKIENNKTLALEKALKDDKKKIKEKYKKRKKEVLIVCILFNVLFLFLFKYLKFFTININNLFEIAKIDYHFKILKLIAPIGISFYTLQALSYLFDVYNGTIKADKNFIRVALFMSFFPQIMEGPIARYNDTAFDLYSGNKITYHNLCFGLQRISWGLFKKMIIADRLNILVKTVFNNYASYSGPTLFLGAVCYTIMLYMDFSGAMDFVLGMGEIFDVKIPENFRQPFFSKNISEFWTRWHISLGKWFKDYIYYPISLSKPMKKMTLSMRKILGNHYGPLVSGTFALFVVWLLNGLWHGAGWTFILFGMYHFILISLGNIINPQLDKLYLKLKINNSTILRILKSIKVTILVIFGELIFRADKVKIAFGMIHKIFTDFSINKKELITLGLDLPDYLVIIISLVIVFIVGILKEKNINIRSKIEEKPIVLRWIIFYLLLFSILIFGAFGPGYQPVDPMYADF